MAPVIRIPESLYKRLENLAEGFDTPANVIEKLLNQYSDDGLSVDDLEAIPSKKPQLVFYPENDDDFKDLLITHKKAYIRLHKKDGTIENIIWKANRFSKNSNLRGNLWSGYLRGWKAKGVIKAELAINESDLG